MNAQQLLEQAEWFYDDYERTFQGLMDSLPDRDAMFELWISQHAHTRLLRELHGESPLAAVFVEKFAAQADRTGRALFRIWDEKERSTRPASCEADVPWPALPVAGAPPEELRDFLSLHNGAQLMSYWHSAGALFLAMAKLRRAGGAVDIELARQHHDSLKALAKQLRATPIDHLPDLAPAMEARAQWFAELL